MSRFDPTVLDALAALDDWTERDPNRTWTLRFLDTRYYPYPYECHVTRGARSARVLDRTTGAAANTLAEAITDALALDASAHNEAEDGGNDASE